MGPHHTSRELNMVTHKPCEKYRPLDVTALLYRRCQLSCWTIMILRFRIIDLAPEGVLFEHRHAERPLPVLPVGWPRFEGFRRVDASVEMDDPQHTYSTRLPRIDAGMHIHTGGHCSFKIQCLTSSPPPLCRPSQTAKASLTSDHSNIAAAAVGFCLNDQNSSRQLAPSHKLRPLKTTDSLSAAVPRLPSLVIFTAATHCYFRADCSRSGLAFI
ncbi:hypothetical protein LshimejAT787_2000890 [Lyophyllum shimeji]|uniref:Uncharacterized protein n=1 Tax=Lyophyllum shimeji TaxID=47721 RepID=A0A9P3Q0Z2_LYOSH|nr:hypothetical protein LshimejAT787_2000890 [Lyophyllum shimeji]